MENKKITKKEINKKFNKEPVEGVEIYARNIINNGVITSDSKTKVVTDDYKGVGQMSSFSKRGGREKWYQKWWGILILGIIASAVAGIFILYFLPTSENNKPGGSMNNLARLEENINSKFSLESYLIRENDDLDIFLSKIREKYELRSLVALESDKTLKEVPNGTYSFVASAYLQVSNQEQPSEILNARVRRFNDYPSLYFEAYKMNNGDINLIGFISEEALSQTGMLDGKTNKNLTIFPAPTSLAKTLVLIPVNRIVSSADRNIVLDDKNSIEVLDLQIK